MRTLILLIALAAVAPAQEDPPATTQPVVQPSPRLATGFLYRQVTYEDKAYPYAIFVPPTYDPAREWPVILFLHGSGERGSDGFKQTEVGLGRAIRRNVERCPAIVVFPQCEERGMWTGPMLEMAKACVQETANAYRLDPRRFYVTGLSMGGAGTWEIATQLRGKVAAIAPICGFIGPWRQPPEAEAVGQFADQLKDIPTWCFHGDEDRAVNVEHSRILTTALKERGATVTYTEYPGGKHNIWDKVYGQRDFWAWLFSHKLPEDE